MRILIAAVGRLKDGAERDLTDRYSARFDACGRAVALGPVTSVELAEARHSDVARRKDDEAHRLLAATARSEARLVLDERGALDGSAAFAARLATLRDGGVSTLAILIGGPDGHGPAALASPAVTIALGRMTLPHGLARVVLMEQLYRAATILSGHPYHRA